MLIVFANTSVNRFQPHVDQFEFRDGGIIRGRHFTVRRFPHSINVSAPDSKLQVQIQTDPRYFEYVHRAEIRDVMDYRLPVARIEDILQGKIWAAMDADRRKSKRQKDLADIARILEVSPSLRSRVPGELLAKLV